MKDWLHSILKWLDHNRYVALGMASSVTLTVWLSACTSTTTGLDGEQQVTRSQLERQIAKARFDVAADMATIQSKAETLVELGELGVSDLDRQDAIKRQVIATFGAVAADAANGNVSPLGAINAAVTFASLLIGGGFAFDNRRKDRKIKENGNANGGG